MKLFLTILAVSVASSLAVADEQLTSSSKKQPELKLLGVSYRLAFVDEQKNRNHLQILNEYIPDGESLERWSSLIAVFHYPEIADLAGMPGELVKAIKSHNPLARFEVHSSPDGKRVMVDFVTWDVDKKFAEFNIFIYQNAVEGKGVLVHQFAMRAYGNAMEKFMIELKGKRVPTIDAVTEFQFPAVTTMQPDFKTKTGGIR